MVKFPEPHDFDKTKKHGGESLHITKRVAESTSQDQLDSKAEDEVLETWIRNTKPNQTTVFPSFAGEYPPESRLSDLVVVYKEVRLENYRIDSIVRWPNGTWKLIEVKTAGQNGVAPSVVGDLLVKSVFFEEIFTVNPDNVERVIVADDIPSDLRRAIGELNGRYDVDIGLVELTPEGE